MYVQKNDYKIRINISLLNMLLQNAAVDGVTVNDVLAEASKIAEDAIASSAGVLYDIRPEFQKQGADRNYYILSLAISIALYNIYQNADDNDIPEKVIKNHDDAMNDLQAISKGKSTIDLPPRPNDPEQQPDPNAPASETTTIQGKGLRRFGSNPKRSHLP
ncbi:MAG: hypothetical protein C0459_03360 [Chitinophaga sp.]|jgi:Protein of unknown function (DUF1320)|nr:hypothetical protein [Chitinophaga sp.]